MEPEAAVDEACERVAAFAALLREAAALPGPVRIDVVTRGALRAVAGDVPRVGGAALAGAFQSAALELPQLAGNLIDLPADFGARDAAALAALPRAAVASSPQVAIRAGAVLVPVLERRAVSALPVTPLREGVYTVLGGFGSLGLVAARALAEHGAREIALVGRTGAGEAAAPALAALRARGVAVRELRADVADASGFAALLEQLRAGGRPLRGIVHCAGALGVLKPVAELSAADVRAAAAVKAIPALCADGELDLFVAFSSIASTWGSRGIGAYAAANALLDAAAGRLAHGGTRALVLHWGPWAESGMARRGDAEQLARIGIAGFDERTGGALLGALLGAPSSELTLVDANWPRFAELLRGIGRGRLLERLAPSAPAAPRATAARPTAPVSAPRGRAEILAAILDDVRSVLGLDADADLDPAAGLMDLGMDSILALELKDLLEARFGLTLPSTLAFDHPNAAAIADLVRRSTAEATAPGEAASAPATALAEVGAVDVEVLSEADIRGRVERIMAELGG